MAIKKIQAYFISFVTVIIILTASVGLIAYGRGYRFDFNQSGFKPTGLISATSDPIGAQVYIDNKLRTATNNSINIDPGWYDIKISKEGYMPWSKKMRVQGEIVTRAEAYLFPTNPSLSPLTTSGAIDPVLSPDGTKLAYVVPETKTGANDKTGIWTLELADRPLGRNRDPQQVATGTGLDLTKTNIFWSPDSTELMVQDGPQNKLFRLYQVGKVDDFTVISSSYPDTLKVWENERFIKQRQTLAAFKQPVIDFATTSAKIISFSPDESKILYEATSSATLPIVINPPLIGTNSTVEERSVTPGRLYVYDSREDRNYFLLDKKEIPQPTPTKKTTKSNSLDYLNIGLLDYSTAPSAVVWLPTSRHLLLTLPGKIDVLEFDRTNWITIYSGPFVNNFVAPWSNGSRIVILTNLNASNGALPNLYTVNLR